MTLQSAGAAGPRFHLDQAKAFGRTGWVVLMIARNRYQAAPVDRTRELLKHSLARPEVRSPKASIVGYLLGGSLVLATCNLPIPSALRFEVSDVSFVPNSDAETRQERTPLRTSAFGARHVPQTTRSRRWRGARAECGLSKCTGDRA